MQAENRKLFENTTDPSSSPSNRSYSYDKLNEYTDITSLKSFTADTHSRKNCALDDKPFVIIQNNCA